MIWYQDIDDKKCKRLCGLTITQVTQIREQMRNNPNYNTKTKQAILKGVTLQHMVFFLTLFRQKLSYDFGACLF